MDFGEVLKNFLPADFTDRLKDGIEKIVGKLEGIESDIKDIKAKLYPKDDESKLEVKNKKGK